MNNICISERYENSTFGREIVKNIYSKYFTYSSGREIVIDVYVLIQNYRFCFTLKTKRKIRANENKFNANNIFNVNAINSNFAGKQFASMSM